MVKLKWTENKKIQGVWYQISYEQDYISGDIEEVNKVLLSVVRKEQNE